MKARGSPFTHPARRLAARPLLETLEDRLVPSTIQGTVFHDMNGNGAQDTGETGRVGVTVYLDQNQNHTLDAGETSTTTDSLGNYSFLDQAENTYYVAATVAGGWAQTSPGETTGPDTFGTVLNHFATPPSSPGDFSGLAWVNGSPSPRLYVVDNGQIGVADNLMYEMDPVTGQLLNTNPVTLPDQVSEITHDGTAFWGADPRIDSLIRFDASGNELQRLTLRDDQGAIIRASAVEWDEASHSLWVLANTNPQSNTSHIYQVPSPDPEEPVVEVIVGQPIVTNVAIRGLAFDGTHLWGNGVDRTRTYKLDTTGEVVASFYSPGPSSRGLAYDGHGLWIVDAGLSTIPGLSRIFRYDLGTPRNHTVDLTTGDATGVDFGQFQLGSVVGQIFNDLDGDGVLDVGEPGLAGWRIFVDSDSDGSFDDWERHVLSDANGNYSLDGLRPGTYSVLQELRQPGWSSVTGGYPAVTIDTSGAVIAGRTYGNSLSGTGPVGTETRVNATIAGAQSTSNGGGRGGIQSVAADSDGNYVVVWQGSDGDGNGTGVFARLFDVNGNPIDDDFRVNDASYGDQYGQAVARADSGQFAVAWTNYGNGNGNVTVRVFNADGTPRTGDVTVAAGSSSTRNWVSSIAMDADGDFVVVYGRAVTKGFATTRYWNAQRYNASGVAQGNAIKVATPKLGDGTATVAMSDAGNFVVVWDDTNGTFDVFAQRYSAAGKAQGGRITVAPSSNTRSEWLPAVAMNDSGAFVVTWNDTTRHVQSGRIFSANGTADGIPFDFGTKDIQDRASVGLDNDGNVVVTWTDNTNVIAQRFTSAGAIDPVPFRVNTTLPGLQGSDNTVNHLNNPSVAVNGNGTFVIVWGGNGVGDDSGVFFQRYDTASAALQAAAAPGNSPAADAVTEADLRPLVDEAIRRWEASGLTSEQSATLRTVTITVADLGGNYLGLAYQGENRIVIDDDAAGWGWFVDATLWEDSEFTTPGDQGELGRIDLLTALLHEMGHVVGLDHGTAANDLMFDALAVGERHLPPTDPLVEPSVLTGRWSPSVEPVVRSVARGNAADRAIDPGATVDLVLALEQIEKARRGR